MTDKILKTQPRLSIEILWGIPPACDQDAPILYQFETQAELTAFRLGIEASAAVLLANGWLDYEILYTDEES